MKCPSCRKRQAIAHPQFGILPCKVCQKRQRELHEPDRQIEFVPERIKEDRRAYRNDILQPDRKGNLSKEWMDVYGKNEARKRGFSEDEIAHAKNVWNDDVYFKGE